MNDLETHDGDGWKLASNCKDRAIKGRIESVSVNFDDREETAEIDVVFVEQLRGRINLTRRRKSNRTAKARSPMASMSLRMSSATTCAWPSARRARNSATPVDPTQGLLGQCSGLSRAGAQYMKSVDVYVRTLNATLNQVPNPENSLVATLNHTTNLSGAVIGSLARCAERYSLLYDSLKTAPSRFTASFCAGMNAIEAATDMVRYTTIHTAQRAALDLGYALKADKRRPLPRSRRGKRRRFLWKAAW